MTMAVRILILSWTGFMSVKSIAGQVPYGPVQNQVQPGGYANQHPQPYAQYPNSNQQPFYPNSNQGYYSNQNPGYPYSQYPNNPNPLICHWHCHPHQNSIYPNQSPNSNQGPYPNAQYRNSPYPQDCHCHYPNQYPNYPGNPNVPVPRPPYPGQPQHPNPPPQPTPNIQAILTPIYHRKHPPSCGPNCIDNMISLRRDTTYSNIPWSQMNWKLQNPGIIGRMIPRTPTNMQLFSQIQQTCGRGGNIVTLVRFYHEQKVDHVYEWDQNEKNKYPAEGYRTEGPIGHCAKHQGVCGATVPLTRWRSETNTDTFYMTNNRQPGGYQNRGVVCWVWP